MNEETLKKMVERLVVEMTRGDTAQGPTAQEREMHAPSKGTVSLPPEAEGGRSQNGPSQDGQYLDDITQVDLRKQYLVPAPKHPQEFLALKAKTPARLGVGRAGARYKTCTMLRFRADHAAAQDSVFSLVGEDYPAKHGFVPVQTLCKDKDEYLTRPDKGRRFDEANQAILKQTLGQGAQVVLAVGDGLSSAAIEANGANCAQAIQAGLKGYGIETPPIPFVKFCRVGAGDHIGELTGCQVVCLLVGERPGLVTAESMSAYITYMPRLGVPESKRTVVSNIHKGGTGAVEAGAHIAELIHTILEKKASGVGLVRS